MHDQTTLSVSTEDQRVIDNMPLKSRLVAAAFRFECHRRRNQKFLIDEIIADWQHFIWRAYQAHD